MVSERRAAEGVEVIRLKLVDNERRRLKLRWSDVIQKDRTTKKISSRQNNWVMKT